MVSIQAPVNPNPHSHDSVPFPDKIDRPADTRLPDLTHLQPAWTVETYVRNVYPDGLADNAVYWDEQAERFKRQFADAARSPLHNYFYKQETPHDSPNFDHPNGRKSRPDQTAPEDDGSTGSGIPSGESAT